ncbi:MAG: redox-regulated ATPase YchF [Clostridia bacterium]
MLSSGIVGLPMTGKTTLFNLLTKRNEDTSKFFSGKTKTNKGVAEIPDKRVDKLIEVYNPKRGTYATLEVVDVAGLVRGASSGAGVGNNFIEDVRSSDALIHVVRAFNNKDIPHIEESINPMRDIETVNMELLFSDLEFVEKRMERIKDSKKVTEEQKEELIVLEYIYNELSDEIPYYQIEFNEEQERIMKPYKFLTNIPMILVINLDDDQLQNKSYDQREKIIEYAKNKDMRVIETSLQTEIEISQLDKESQQDFLDDLGIDEPGVNLVAKAMYNILNLISFFTVGEDEVRAWTIKKGLNAQQAAGKIHSDLERGFIRAETVSYEDFKNANYSMTTAKEMGVWRLEGKGYIVKDGDILNIRFNV